MDTDAALTARIAEIVRGRINSSGHPIKAIAEDANIPRTTFIRKLKGAAESPFTPAELARLGQYTGMTPAEIVTQAQADLEGGEAA